MSVRFVSWNVNGLRAVSAKPDWAWFGKNTAQIVALQETKAQETQLSETVRSPEGWESYFCSSQKKKGYSGVAVFSKMHPLTVQKELPSEDQQGEGRILQLEFPEFYFFNGYFPNGGSAILDAQGKATGNFTRLEYKLQFFNAFLLHAEQLRRHKPIVFCGDLNIAHKPIDLARPKQNEQNTGFLEVERAVLDYMETLGYVDTFRLIHGDTEGQYTWWSYKTRARSKNLGWRIDYFFVSQELQSMVKDAWIEADVFGSDHCPVGLELAM
ncbi:MAG: exodeoxyribonuclease III [Desulfovibrio sp.]|nr:exodeoxyribonuclease III [Desulfovibrio sp.]